jgi:ABC-type thiamin/hydroxymethylpyrimidine transport system permease subunit
MLMYSYTATNAGYHIIVYVVAWRSGRVKAGVLGGGILGTVDRARIVRLARKQHARILAVS